MTDSCITFTGGTSGMNLCIHGMYPALGCEKCSVEHRLNQLESLAKANMSIEVKQLFEAGFKHIYERLDKLEKETNQFGSVLNTRDYKKPHKCPLCAGCGNVKLEVETRVLQITSCNACQGKGIVWG